MKKFLLTLCLSAAFLSGRPADIFYGFSAGISFDFGTNVNRLGLSGGAYYAYDFAQVNISLKAYYNFQSIGLKKKTPEIVLAGGINFCYGKKDTVRNRFTGPGENNTAFPHAFGYSYLRYWDKNQTSQSTGLFNIQAGQFRFLTENDLFAGGKGWRDRFRTGGFKVDYTVNDLRFALTSALWTGDFIGCDIVKDSLYPSRFGYRRTERSQYGNFSLGLLSAQVNWLLPGVPLNQDARLNLGVDSEWVRHVLQNKLVHDQCYLPKKWINHENPHIPMLSDKGDPYLFDPAQKVKPASCYFNLGLNSPVFY
ncbi:MAG: hypothetical protein HYZ14_09440 [Bacteroidetes bacterium]|nr:hypothetical protein [Bacteroidota bacterium]